VRRALTLGALKEAAMFRRLKIVPALALAAALAGVGAVPYAAASQTAAKPAASEARPIDINTADGAAFESVPGIGKSLSARILAFRDKNGPFQTVDDLLKIQGIGEKSIQKLRPYLTVAKAK
jgi:comEA protein